MHFYATVYFFLPIKVVKDLTNLNQGEKIQYVFLAIRKESEKFVGFLTFHMH